MLLTFLFILGVLLSSDLSIRYVKKIDTVKSQDTIAADDTKRDRDSPQDMDDALQRQPTHPDLASPSHVNGVEEKDAVSGWTLSIGIRLDIKTFRIRNH